METRVEVSRGVPDEEVAREVKIYQANPDYISHDVKPEGNGKNTITATLRKHKES